MNTHSIFACGFLKRARCVQRGSVLRIAGRCVPLFIGLMTSTSMAASPTDVDAIFQGMSARITAIHTGAFHYKFGTCRVDPTQEKPWPWEPNVWSPDRETASLTLAGDEWVLRWPSGCTDMHRDSFDMSYLATLQETGKIRRSCSLSAPVATMKKEIKGGIRFRILQAGTVPWPAIWDYLKSHRHEAIDRGRVPIEGDKTHLLEWRIPKRDYSQELYFSWDEMLLRVYVIPEMGYAVRRIGYCTPDGKMRMRFESNNFRKVAKGIWFPWNYYVIVDQTHKGRGYYVTQYLVDDITDVNEPVPESVFAMEIPAGTEIWDSRPGHGNIRFTVEKALSLSDIDEVIQTHVSDAPVPSSNSIWRIGIKE